jgi:hypothetical protein
VFIHAPDDMVVFAAPVSDLLKKPDTWLNDLGPSAVYVSDCTDEFGNSDELTQMLGLVRPNYTATLRGGGIYGVGEVFMLDRSTPSVARQGSH